MQIKQAIPTRVKRLARDPMMTIAPRRTAYSRLKAAVPAEPVTFTEKLLHKMAFDRRPILRTFADRVAVREYVAERVGGEVLPHLYGVFTDATDIRWDVLPEEFVLKASHGSGAVAIIWRGSRRGRQPHPGQLPDWRWRGLIHPDDLDRAEMARLAGGWLEMSYEMFAAHPEWAYGGIQRQLVAEELLLNQEGRLPNDYKFYVFGGECRAVHVHADRHGDHQTQWLSPAWTRLNGHTTGQVKHSGQIPQPENLATMLALAEELGRGIDFVRVDLYDLGRRVVFGELTNYPNAANAKYDPPKFDAFLGSTWNLPWHRSS